MSQGRNAPTPEAILAAFPAVVRATATLRRYVGERVPEAEGRAHAVLRAAGRSGHQATDGAARS